MHDDNQTCFNCFWPSFVIIGLMATKLLLVVIWWPYINDYYKSSNGDRKFWLPRNKTSNVTTLLWESVRMRLTLSKWGLGSPPRLLKLQSLIIGVKTPHIWTFFISLESYQSVDVENELAWAIWTSTTQVMEKRKGGSQTTSLTPDHQKSGIDPTPMRVRGVQHTIGKFLTKATTFL